MQKSLLRSVLEPLLTRVGTALAGILVGAGMAAQHAPTFTQVFVIVGLVGVDFVTRKLVKS